MTGRLRIALVAVCLGALTVATPTHAAFPGANGKIAFGAGSKLYTINSDGSGETAIDPGSSCGYNPDWSADGSKIVFYRCGVIGVVNSDGTGVHSVPVSPDCGGCFFHIFLDPSWNPDGTRIAYHEDQEFGSEETGFDVFSYIRVVNEDGTGDTALTGDGTSGGPSWSPDGAKIGFSQLASEGGGIYTMDPDGANVTKVPNTLPGDTLSDWSPDGHQLAFNRRSDVYKINLDGTGLTRLTTSPTGTEAYGPAWAPDGQKIAFVVQRSVPYRSTLMVMNADGSGQTSLTTTFDPFGRPGWQPILGPQRSDYKNAAQFCKAEREYFGDAAFAKKYGTNANGANAYGKCVSTK